MKPRAVIELLQSTCPECGEPQSGEANYCCRCGNLLVSLDSVSEEVSEKDMKALATASEASVVSDVMSAPHITFLDCLLVLGIPSLLALVGAYRFMLDYPGMKTTIFLMEAVFVPVYMVLQFLIVCRPFLRFRSILRNGRRLPAVVLGYSSCMNHSMTGDDKNGLTIYPTVKVLTKIDGVDRSIVFYVPDNMSEQQFPVGTEITIVAGDKGYIIDPKNLNKERAANAPQPSDAAAVKRLESLNDIDPLTGLPVSRGTRR
ncbi:MAG: hypothetical protein J5845_08725 [Lachnospiraceae bacterium]|nr:hypothetical protein [Lachnospiraceae bacterium]